MLPQINYKLYDSTSTAWDSMFEVLQRAEHSIYWEIYTFLDDKAGKRFIDVLCAKARAGLVIKIVLDSFGSRLMSRRSIGLLRAAGVEVLWYNTFYPQWRFGRWLNRLWHRNHRKVLIVDESVAFIGGVNIAFSATEWYDFHLKIKGEIIKPLLYEFAKTYKFSDGSSEVVEKFLENSFVAPSEKNDLLTFISPSPYARKSYRFLKKFYINAVKSAKKDFTLITPYYTPHRKFLRALAQARERGVEITIITPVRSDHRFLDYMASYFLELSEKLGAKIYFLPLMNHAKGFLVDQEMGLIGSCNFTTRSFHANAEADVLFKDPAMVKDLSDIIDRWKKEAAPGYVASGKKERPIRSGLLAKIAQYFQDYV